MHDLAYSELRRICDEGDPELDALVKKYDSDEELRKKIVGALASLNKKREISEGEAPLLILSKIDASFGDAIRCWTSGNFAEMRKAQEEGQGEFLDRVRCLESRLRYLPLWIEDIQHTSSDESSWRMLLSNGKLELKSFLSCSRLGYKTSYGVKITLVFRKARGARLIGSLSAELGEGEVLLPRGAQFEVVERAGSKITLEQAGF